jgi:hypothetical protein
MAPHQTVADERFAPVELTPTTRRARVRLALPPDDLLSATECVFREYVEQGIEVVILIRLEADAEFDLADLIRFHRTRGQAVTPVADGRRSLPMWVVGADRVRQTQRMAWEDLKEEAFATPNLRSCRVM